MKYRVLILVGVAAFVVFALVYTSKRGRHKDVEVVYTSDSVSEESIEPWYTGVAPVEAETETRVIVNGRELVDGESLPSGESVEPREPEPTDGPEEPSYDADAEGDPSSFGSLAEEIPLVVSMIATGSGAGLDDYFSYVTPELKELVAGGSMASEYPYDLLYGKNSVGYAYEGSDVVLSFGGQEYIFGVDIVDGVIAGITFKEMR